MLAIKGNKEYTITETEATDFKNRGFDIYDDKGILVESAEEKKIAFSEYEKIVAKNKALSAELKKLKKGAETQSGESTPEK